MRNSWHQEKKTEGTNKSESGILWRDIYIDVVDIKKIIRGYYEKLHINTFENYKLETLLGKNITWSLILKIEKIDCSRIVKSKRNIIWAKTVSHVCNLKYSSRHI